jgi:2-oxoisovalerate dehydrogenase E1 component
LSRSLKKTSGIGVVFIGDGTLGEGVVYETLNLISKLQIPLLVVCEHNQYAQSTPTSATIAGDITARAEAFGIRSYQGSTDDPTSLLPAASEAIEYVREQRRPAFFLVDTVRLNAHSKGDDDRSESEIAVLRERDVLTRLERANDPTFVSLRRELRDEINQVIDEVAELDELDLQSYTSPGSIQDPEALSWTPLRATGERQVSLLNSAFHSCLDEDPRVVFLGEDIVDPYGGAFKVTKGLSTKHPDRVISTPISEAAISGMANGLALAGMKPFVELMFGDFVTLAFDQIVNHASKFFHMYNRHATCPVVFRTPMGGGRGYGPTHSQTLDKHLLGIDNVKVLALNRLVDPRDIVRPILDESHPVILIENKLDYGVRVGPPDLPNFISESSNTTFPTVRIRPTSATPKYTVVTYGGTLAELIPSINPVFCATEALPEILVLSSLSPIDYRPILDSIRRTGSLVVLESGSLGAGFGAEIVASVMEHSPEQLKRSLRIGALPFPIPSVRSLEDEILPTRARIIRTIVEFIQ